MMDEQKLTDFMAKMETKTKRINNNLLRNEKEMNKKEEGLEQKIDRVEKNLTDAFIVLKKQLEDNMHRVVFRTEEMQANLKNNVSTR